MWIRLYLDRLAIQTTLLENKNRIRIIAVVGAQP